MRVFQTTFPVRYYETDKMAVVHHSNYIRYFENARSQMMLDLGLPVEKMEDKYGVFCPIVSVTCHFKRAARMGDTLTATAEIVRPPLAKLIVRQTVVNQDGELCAEGEVVLGFIDRNTFRPVRCPEELYELFTDKS
ncbi:MAG: acyl-CoA thioesterase [Bacteroidales bacterium]|jgi:acyl-CoA thioester hydrolase|nr:acyl-CoA thioesterase [Bacteroidales bacterium]MBQ4299365.1 acyl-CoA thioesterase [Bacteroidales bacterium]